MSMVSLRRTKFGFVEIYFLFEVVVSAIHGKRLHYYEVPEKTVPDSNRVPRQVSNSLFNEPNDYYRDARPSYTVFGPSFKPHHRGGKSLNLTLTPPPASLTQARIINNPDVYRDRNEIPVEDEKHRPQWTPNGLGINSQSEGGTCVCVPYYLCKDGVLVNSGGLTLASGQEARTSSKATHAALENKTETHLGDQEYAVEYLLVMPQQSCDYEREECCRIPHQTADHNPNGVNYPVATPVPDTPVHHPFYPKPPRRRQQECGVQHAYGVRGRVQNLLYHTDVSEFGEYPWQAAILKKSHGEQQSLYLCGGVLISHQWVATAAHCTKNARITKLIVRLGEWDVHRKDEIYTHVDFDVAGIVNHPQFSAETLQNDLSLLRLRDIVDPQLPHITPVCLPHVRQSFVGHRCWVSGWGKDSFGPQGEYQSVLKEVDVPVVSSSVCEKNLRKTQLGSGFRLYPGFLCAGGEPGKDACTGDGGSPLVCHNRGVWYVIGLVSWGIGCGQPGVPGIYTNMAYYKDWITSITLR